MEERINMAQDESADRAIFHMRSELIFGTGCARILDWIGGHQTVSLDHTYMINLAVSPRPTPAWGSYLDGSRVNGKIGRVFFIPPGHTIRAGTGEGGIRALTCTFEARLIDDLLLMRPDWDESALTESLGIHDAQIRNLLAQIYKAASEEAFGSALLVEGLVRAMTVCLVRRFGLSSATDDSARLGGLAPWRLQRIKDRFYSDLPLPSTSELAEICGLSVRQVSRAFKTSTGQTLAEFAAQAMLERSRELLLQPNLSIEEVARAIGYSSASNFNVAFQRAAGFKPSQMEGRRRASKSASSATRAAGQKTQ